MTPSEKAYQFIVDYKKANDGVSPSIREISDEVYGPGGSTSMGAYCVNKLISQKRIVRLAVGGRSSRDLMVVGAQWLPPEEVGDE